jgi:hypothetical protein
MSAILLFNHSWDSEAAFEEGRAPSARALRADWAYWNLWTRRDIPFGQVAGSTIVLIDSWDKGRAGQFSWVIKPTSVAEEECPDKNAAIRRIAQLRGESVPVVRRNDYTANSAPDARFLIYWEAGTVKRLPPIPRPPGRIFRPNGWRIVSGQQLASWGISLDGSAAPTTPTTSTKPPKQAAGQGFGADADVNDTLERHSLAMTRRRLRRLGWTGVKVVGGRNEAKRPWDIEGTDPRGRSRRVEVKGTQGGTDSALFSRREVEEARSNSLYVLSICSGIKIDPSLIPFRASGGHLELHDPWCPTDGELSVVSYSWRSNRRHPKPTQLAASLGKGHKRGTPGSRGGAGV